MWKEEVLLFFLSADRVLKIKNSTLKECEASAHGAPAENGLRTFSRNTETPPPPPSVKTVGRGGAVYLSSDITSGTHQPVTLNFMFETMILN
jgi:hypothetical protein